MACCSRCALTITNAPDGVINDIDFVDATGVLTVTTTTGDSYDTIITTSGGDTIQSIELDANTGLITVVTDTGGPYVTTVPVVWSLSDGTTTELVFPGNTVIVDGTEGATATVSATDTLTISGHSLEGAGAPATDPDDTAQPWQYWDTTNDALYIWDTVAGAWTGPVGGSFSITDGTTTEVVGAGDTITYADGQGTTVAVSATDTVTVTAHLLSQAGPFLLPPADTTKVWFGYDTTSDVPYIWDTVAGAWQTLSWSLFTTDHTGANIVTPIDINLDTLNLQGDYGITTELVGNALTINGNFIAGAGAPAVNPDITTKCWIYQDETNDVLYFWDTTGATWVEVGNDTSSIITGNNVLTGHDGTTVLATGTYEHSPDGTAVGTTIIDTRAASNPYDPAANPLSTLASTNVQDAIDELATVTHGWRIQGPVGGGNTAQDPTRDDPIGVNDQIQHRGHVLLGGAFGDVNDAVRNWKLQVTGPLALRTIDSENSFRQIHFINSAALADERRYSLIHRKADIVTDGYIRIAPMLDDDTRIKDGFVLTDRRGNAGLWPGLQAAFTKNGAEKNLLFTDDTGIVPESQVIAPSAAWGGPNSATIYDILGEIFVMDGTSNVTQLSSHSAALADILNLSGSGYTVNSYNTISGYGEGIDVQSGRKVAYNIDTGAYEILTRNSVLESTGTDERLVYAKNHASLESIGFFGERGWEFWNFIQEQWKQTVVHIQYLWDKDNEEARMEYKVRPVYQPFVLPKYLEEQFNDVRPGEEGREHKTSEKEVEMFDRLSGIMAEFEVMRGEKVFS